MPGKMWNRLMRYFLLLLFRWKMGISHFGETSMQVYQHATSVHTGKTLLEGVSHTILVDPQTRKPTPYPDEFKKSIQVCTEQIHVLVKISLVNFL